MWLTLDNTPQLYAHIAPSGRSPVLISQTIVRKKYFLPDRQFEFLLPLFCLGCTVKYLELVLRPPGFRFLAVKLTHKHASYPTLAQSVWLELNDTGRGETSSRHSGGGMVFSIKSTVK